MGTKSDGRAVAVTAHQAMAIGLALAAAEAAGEAAALGGYTLSPEEQRTITRALSGAALAMVALVEDFAVVTDEQLEGAARDLGVRIVREVLGPPAAMAMN